MYSVSHDLRAPVRAVIGYSQLLAEEHLGSLDDDGRKLLAVIADEALRLGAMIDDVLTLSRLGDHVLSPEAVDMTAFVHEIAHDVAAASNGRRVPAVVETLADVRCDRALLGRVWAALLTNASIATCRKADPHVNVSATVEPARVIYNVRDNGIGFDMKYSGTLFSMFQKLHRTDDFPGRGVGLAIVARIVGLHGGSVWVDGRAGIGATFSFALPRA